jgi:hypothetical protein
MIAAVLLLLSQCDALLLPATAKDSVFECIVVNTSALSSFCAPEFNSTPTRVCTDMGGFAYAKTAEGYKKQAAECNGAIRRKEQCSNDPSACRASTQPEYCGARDQSCKHASDCLAICFKDCFPCNDKGDCDTLVAFGLLAPEGDDKCSSSTKYTQFL